ncbi:MAG: hypothetical protein BA868_09830 [Desulfobacterales bacterium C00003106]|nr:MAG: hypothetical protein BA868_09830 [Desulfobacterales bacterium C00003106]
MNIKLIRIIKVTQFWTLLAVCSFMSLVPNTGEGLEAVSDKLLHCIGYFVLMISVNIAYRPNKRFFQKIAFLLMYSFFMEVGQHFVPNRSFSLHDIVANFAGLLIATIILVKCRSN